MGVLNITPDSFYDGGKFTSVAKAVKQAEQMVADGASIIDVGAESTRPGAMQVTAAQELARLTPVVSVLVKEFGQQVLISIDTYKSEVAEAMLALGARMINDITALQHDPKIAEVVAQHDAWLVLSHIFGTPQTMMQETRVREDVVADVIADLQKSIDVAKKHGVTPEKISIDPGFGFGKSYEQNLQMLSQLERFTALGHPIMVGFSRKKTTGIVLQKKRGLSAVPDASERLFPSIAAHVLAAERGATIIRTHDVREQADALAFLEALQHVE